MTQSISTIVSPERNEAEIDGVIVIVMIRGERNEIDH